MSVSAVGNAGSATGAASASTDVQSQLDVLAKRYKLSDHGFIPASAFKGKPMIEYLATRLGVDVSSISDNGTSLNKDNFEKAVGDFQLRYSHTISDVSEGLGTHNSSGLSALKDKKVGKNTLAALQDENTLTRINSSVTATATANFEIKDGQVVVLKAGGATIDEVADFLKTSNLIPSDSGTAKDIIQQINLKGATFSQNTKLEIPSKLYLKLSGVEIVADGDGQTSFPPATDSKIGDVTLTHAQYQEMQARYRLAEQGLVDLVTDYADSRDATSPISDDDPTTLTDAEFEALKNDTPALTPFLKPDAVQTPAPPDPEKVNAVVAQVTEMSPGIVQQLNELKATTETAIAALPTDPAKRQVALQTLVQNTQTAMGPIVQPLGAVIQGINPSTTPALQAAMAPIMAAIQSLQGLFASAVGAVAPSAPAVQAPGQ